MKQVWHNSVSKANSACIVEAKDELNIFRTLYLANCNKNEMKFFMVFHREHIPI